MPQATRSDDHRTYRCYLRGPDGIRELSPCGPGARMKLFLGALAVNEAWSRNAMARPASRRLRGAASQLRGRLQRLRWR